MTYTADECIDVPKFRRIPETIALTPEIKAYYNELVEEAIAARGNKRVMENAFLRMRQLSSGFIGLKDDETGEKAEVEFNPNPKLERLLDILDVLPEERKALVFYQYTVSGRRIATEIKKEFKTKPIWLWSGTKNPREEMQRFIEEPDCRYAVVNNQVGAYSLDGLQVANYEFFFESPLSVIDRSQAEKRIVRQGQLHKCFLYDLIVEGTVDERILEFHQEGRDLFKALLSDPARVLKGFKL
jgi:SNF2 family DNA or RNA helicase